MAFQISSERASKALKGVGKHRDGCVSSLQTSRKSWYSGWCGGGGSNAIRDKIKQA